MVKNEGAREMVAHSRCHTACLWQNWSVKPAILFLFDIEIQNYIVIKQNITSPIKNSIKTVLKILPSSFALLNYGKITDSKFISFSCAFKEYVKHGNTSKKEACRNGAYKHKNSFTNKKVKILLTVILNIFCVMDQ